MKKIVSVVLSLLLILSYFVFGSVYTFAYTKEKAPQYSLGETFTAYAKTKSPNSILNNPDSVLDDAYQAAFVPQKTGYYAFEFAEDFQDSGEMAMLFSQISTADDMLVHMAICLGEKLDSNELIKDVMMSLYGFPTQNNPSVCCKLEKGETYYLTLINTGSAAFSSEVTIHEHTHDKYNSMTPSYVSSESFDYNIDGEYYTACSLDGCNFYEVTKTIYSVKSISLSKTKYTYDGKAKKPSVTIKDRKGNKIDKSNYKVKYYNNKAVGTAEVVITFKNEYTGSFSKTFKINPKGTSISKLTAKKKGFTVKWKKQTTKTTGYQIQLATDKNFKKNKKTVTVKKNKTISKTVSGLKAKKKYYVRVRTYKTVDGTKYYSSWSKAKTITTKK